MKKILLLLVVSSALFSCGNEKSKDAPVVNEEKKTAEKYALEIDAIYEKDDSLVVFYEKDGYFKYDTPISLKIKGSPTTQRLIIDLPEVVENLKLEVSTNKEQSVLTMTNLSVKKGSKVVVDGSNLKYSEYFLTDESFTWDIEKSRYNLKHTNKYPPGLIGNEVLKSMLDM